MGFSPRFSTVALALLGSTLLVQETRSQELTECLALSADGFDYEVTLDNFDIRWSVDTEAETISFEASTTAQAWIGVGFSVDGEMIGSDAVIGLPDTEEVLEHNLAAKDVEQVTPYSDQEITNATISQDTIGTIIAFTRPLSPSTEDKETLSATAGDETWLIYAFGVANELANHETGNRGSVLLDLFCGDAAGDGESSDAPTPAPGLLTTAPTESPTLSPTDSGDGGDGGDGGGTASPPSAEEEDEDAEGTETEADAAFRVTGGGSLWVAAATATAAMLGAAMAV